MPPRKRVGIKIKIRIQHAQGGRGDLRGDSGDSGRGGGGGGMHGGENPSQVRWMLAA